MRDWSWNNLSRVSQMTSRWTTSMNTRKDSKISSGDFLWSTFTFKSKSGLLQIERVFFVTIIRWIVWKKKRQNGVEKEFVEAHLFLVNDVPRGAREARARNKISIFGRSSLGGFCIRIKIALFPSKRPVWCGPTSPERSSSFELERTSVPSPRPSLPFFSLLFFLVFLGLTQNGFGGCCSRADPSPIFVRDLYEPEENLPSRQIAFWDSILKLERSW